MDVALSAAPKQFRFVVKSADEAVNLIRDKLGERARVVSVKQVEGKGLSRFLQAPKLEIVAQVDPEPPPTAPGAVVQAALPSPEIAKQEAEGIEPSTYRDPRMGKGPVPQAQVTQATFPQATASVDSAVTPKGSNSGDQISRLLDRAGFSAVIVSALQGYPEWEKLNRLPLRSALNEVTILLRTEFEAGKRQPLTDRIAYLGSPGVGKTTALCKRVAAGVFMRGESAAVLKLDTDKPNPGEGLAVFCEVLGVPLLRAAEDLAGIAPGVKVYVDLPGINSGDVEEVQRCGKILDELKVESRAMVVNAAYDSQLIKAAYRLGDKLGATHAIFTHLDELPGWGKLWEFLLRNRLEPWYLSAGQNIAGEIEEEIFEAMIRKTFPV